MVKLGWRFWRACSDSLAKDANQPNGQTKAADLRQLAGPSETRSGSCARLTRFLRVGGYGAVVALQ